jgi:hypothetical protein
MGGPIEEKGQFSYAQFDQREPIIRAINGICPD